MARAALALAGLALLGTAAPAQQPAGALDWLHGGWAGTGTVQGSPSQATLAATVAGTTLTTQWGDAATEQGRTTYRREASGALEVTDEVLRRDGQWHVFASHRMTRQ